MSEQSLKDTKSFIFTGMGNDDSDFIPIMADGGEDDLLVKNLPDTLPILPLRNTVLFPGVVFPISVGRIKSLKLVREVYQSNGVLGVIAQLNPDVDEPSAKDLHKIGTMAKILKILEMPDGNTTVIIQGKQRFRLEEMVADEPYHRAKVEKLEEFKPDENTSEFEATVESLKDIAIKIAKNSANMSPEATFALRNIENPSFLINFICSNAEIKVKEKQGLLEQGDLKERGVQAVSYLVRELQLVELKKDIQSKVKTDMDQQQREYLLQQQMKTIQDELGGNPTEKEINELKERAKKKKWSKEIADVFEKEVNKMYRLNPAAGEYSIQLTYVQTLLDLPWNEYSDDNFDMKHAQEVLDEDHYGLELVKERILEHLAVLKLKNDMKSPIICLYGPPGVGKTSLGKSVARSLGRNFIRMSLGGLHDESEIRGHRKTYIGAMPGRIVQNIKKAKTSNPVFILDEVDKISRDFHGDPASALLEVLDPEQNSEFHDNYLDMEYDLSKVMFIATANTLNTISPPLLDRMELIEVSGYLVEEKVEIAKRHLWTKQLKNHGLADYGLKVNDGVFEYVIEKYTRESGVRALDKQLAKLVRKLAKKIAFDEKVDKVISIETILDCLGVPTYLKEKYQGNEFAGVVTGLAWTSVGGQILYVESSLSKGKGQLTLTGNLGEVMKESAMLALEYLKAHADSLKIDPDVFNKWNVHVHVPEGAIPKDGPSAGVTMVTSLASAFTQRKVKNSMAMTGEITLRGKVLPVGGIKEKILAAKRAGINEIILSEDNKKDIEEIKDIYIKGLKFHYVKTIADVLSIALLKTKVDNAVKID
ncbi:MAG: endopeptidase La [Prolixibacteraceae bacterium]|jgi:ATP-dependent Lon protease|nr:endopeptidase La [Prolixibacteraceae bacterium]